jgi:hypothetical protein
MAWTVSVTEIEKAPVYYVELAVGFVPLVV